MSAPLSTAEILALPAAIDTKTVAPALGLSLSQVYREVAAGRFPLDAIRCGRVIRFRRSDLIALLGIEDTRGGGTA